MSERLCLLLYLCLSPSLRRALFNLGRDDKIRTKVYQHSTARVGAWLFPVFIFFFLFLGCFSFFLRFLLSPFFSFRVISLPMPPTRSQSFFFLSRFPFDPLHFAAAVKTETTKTT